VRLALLAHHWRSAWEWDAGELKEAGERLAAWRRVGSGAEAGRVPERVAGLLAADLDTPGALGVGDELAEAGDRGSVAAVAGVLGVVL
jgi:L-cysteine:1D-myo-inositol 2-amino-2-deoxy-alpha-D-glucopyranoside ligase